ncbi:MAG: ZIP family metal transporter [Acidimicrobiia bacterium]
MEGLQALAVGGLAQSSLLLAGLVVYWVRPTARVIGSLAGFGAGALISAVAFDLIPESSGLGGWQLGLWFLIGAAIFVVSDHIVESRFGEGESAGPLGIVVGSVVDGIPESIILGIQIALGQIVGASFLAAVWVSNIPQALAPSASLAESGWSRAKLAGMWGTVVAACAVTAWLGYLAGVQFGVTGDRAAALAAGGLLAMLTDSLMPYAVQKGGNQAGIWTVVGFGLALFGT